LVSTLRTRFTLAQRVRHRDVRCDDVRPRRPGAGNHDDDHYSVNVHDQYIADHDDYDDHSGHDHVDIDHHVDEHHDDHSGDDHDDYDDIDHHVDEHHDDDDS